MTFLSKVVCARGGIIAQLALYRSLRPQRFDEVVGQEQTVRALRNAVQQGRVSHAYLFCGPRGTGKTSVAKILAKAVNCVEPVDGEPCNRCASCVDIASGSFMDVIEIDAASNRGIDEIRDLREKVRMMPAQGKTKVYIIDEVHMLTTEAFNALLKTLEEPPESVVFVLATTEPQRIPATILSRCQRYNFRRLSQTEILERLKTVAQTQGIESEEKALEVIARRATGSMRDGLSILDQCLAYGLSSITYQDVLNVLGLVDDRFLSEFFGSIMEGDAGLVLTYIDQAVAAGKEALQFVREVADYLRDMLVLKAVGPGAELSRVVGDETLLELGRQAESLDTGLILEVLKRVMQLAGELRFSESPRFIMEVTFLELAGLLGSRDKEKVSASSAIAPVKKDSARIKGKEKIASTKGTEVPWAKVLERVRSKKVTTYALLAEARCLGLKDGLVLVGFKKGFKFHRERMEQKENKDILSNALEETLKQKVEVQFVMLGDNPEDDPLVRKAIEMFGQEMVEIKD